MVKLSENSYVKMGWKYVSYVADGEKYVFYIEPMYCGNDIVYCPNKGEIQLKMIEDIKSINWNRNLSYVDAKYEVKSIPGASLEYDKGAIESTQAGKEFEQLNMFDPQFDMPKEKVHELWCVLERRFAEQAEGKVTIKASNIIEGSVFEKISIPTLIKNEKVVLFFQEG